VHLARGKTIIPGLWEMHGHLVGAGDCALPIMLTYGITNVREMGTDDPKHIMPVRQALRDGRLLGPDMLMAGPEVESLARLEGWTARNKRPWQEVKTNIAPVGTVEDAVREVRRIKAMDVDHIKIKDLCGPPLRALLGEAQRQGIRVAGHLPFGSKDCKIMTDDVFDPATADLMGSAAKGFATVEHHMSFTVSMGNLPEEKRRAVFRKVRSNGTMLTPTFISALPYAMSPEIKQKLVQDDGTLLPDVGPSLRAAWKEQAEEGVSPAFTAMIPKMERDAQLAYQAGVEMLVGTDLGVITIVPGKSVHDEMAQMVQKLPMKPAEALKAATYNAAKATGLTKQFGQIVPGFRANLVLLDANPLKDISATQSISGVVLRGRLLDKRTLSELRTSTRRTMQAGGQCTRGA
jgi:imidazolonepropionase-like amidohydrolase